MSTYLLAFCVGEFDCRADDSRRGWRFGVGRRLGRRSRPARADTAAGSLSFFGEYFTAPTRCLRWTWSRSRLQRGRDGELGPCRVPRELDVVRGGQDRSTRQRIGYVVGHELAHQCSRTWSRWSGGRSSGSTRVRDVAGGGGRTSCTRSGASEPVPRERAEHGPGAGQPQELAPRGGAHRVGAAGEPDLTLIRTARPRVIRTFESHLGEETFREGTRRYVKKHQFANAGTKDLWCVIRRPNEDVAGLCPAGLRRPGSPS